MQRVYISYCEGDSEAALFVATQLRLRGIDLFIDYERMMHSQAFTRRLANEIRARDCLLLVQSHESLQNPLVLAELAHAVEHDITIVPLVLEKIDIRAAGEFAFLLYNVPIDLSSYNNGKQAEVAIRELEGRLQQDGGPVDIISTVTAGSLREMATLNGHTSWVRAVRFSPDGSFLASVSNDKTVRLWDLRGSEPEAVCVLLDHNASVWDVAFSPTDALMTSCGTDNTVRLWDLADAPDLYEFTRFVDHHNPVYSLAFSPDGQMLASASHDNSVHLRNIQRVKQTGIADAIVPLLHSSHVYSVTFSADSELIASASRDSTIRIWSIDHDNLRTMAQARPEFLTGHMSWVNTVAFAPHGRLLASSSADRTIRLWDVDSFTQVGLLDGHTDSVNSAEFSPDGRLLVSTSKDQTVRLWDIQNQREMIALHGHDRWVNHAVFSADGRFLATASGDNTIKLWGVRSTVKSVQ